MNCSQSDSIGLTFLNLDEFSLIIMVIGVICQDFDNFLNIEGWQAASF